MIDASTPVFAPTDEGGKLRIGTGYEEIKQYKESKDYSALIKSIKTLNINDSKLNNYEDIKQIDDHIIESMIKRFFSNA